MIKELHLTNFKSYSYNKIEFKSFTCICGTNGSGKSNVLDALAFALGVGASHLRCSNLKELLKHGEDSGHVKLVLQVDNQKTVFQRHINFQGQSDYKIDGCSSSYTSYVDRLFHFNILVKVRNFIVFQGDIEQLASQSSKQLTKMIEHVSGSYELKQEYDELKHEYESQNAVSLSLLDSKREVSLEMKSALEQQQQIDRFNALSKSSADIITHIRKLNLQRINADYNKCTVDVKHHESNINELKDLLLDSSNSAKLIASNLDELQSKYKVNQESINSLDGQIKSLESSTLQGRLDFLDAKCKQLHSKHDSISSKIKSRTILLNESKSHLSMLPSNSIINSKTVKLYHSLNSSYLSQYHSQLQELESRQCSLFALQTKCSQKNILLSDVMQQLVVNRQHSVELKSNLATIKAAIDPTRLSNLKSKSSSRSNKRSALQSRLAAVTTSINTHYSESKSSKSNQSLNILITTLQAMFDGVIGKLINSITFLDDSLLNPISLALGRYSDAIIVDNEQTCLDCIKWMSAHHYHSRLFLPLTRYTQSASVSNIKPIPGSIELNSCISSKYTNLIATITRDILITDTLAISKHIAFELNLNVKVVSKDCKIIYKSKSMSGGSTFVSTRDVNITELEASKIKIIRELRALDDELVDINKELESFQSSEALLHEQLEVIRQHDIKLSYLTKQQSDLESELESANKELGEHEMKISKLELFINNSRQEHFKTLTDQVGCTIDVFISELDTNTPTVTSGTIKEMELKLELELKKMELIKTTINECEMQSRATSKELDAVTIRKDSLTSELQALNTTKIELQESINLIKNELDLINRNIGKCKSKIIQSRGIVKQLQSEMDELSVQRDNLGNSTDMDVDEPDLDLQASADIDSRLVRLQVELNEIKREMDDLQISDIKDKLDTTNKRMSTCNNIYNKSKKELKEIKNEFNRIKEQRQERFNNAYNKMNSNIDGVYKSLTGGGTAYLSIDGEMDTIEDIGIHYHTMPPAKRFREMENLSGGEKTMAALGLIFTIQEYKKSPFMILDEVDAALDMHNTRKFIKFMIRQSRDIQIIMISHKQIVYEQAVGLVGIYKRQEDSHVVCLDLGLYKEE
eukprot:NODE_5_length_49639_cov_0.484336.p2 type:complete len:1098 gc:universal NODE_5_length_49639_cov_0.484336:12807-9514(-)